MAHDNYTSNYNKNKNLLVIYEKRLPSATATVGEFFACWNTLRCLSEEVLKLVVLAAVGSAIHRLQVVQVVGTSFSLGLGMVNIPAHGAVKTIGMPIHRVTELIGSV